jgi:hypothetical protein
MKIKIAYICFVCIGLTLISSVNFAQTGSEIKFKLLGEPSTTYKDSVTVSAAINAKQLASGSGIHFTLIVKNNSGNAISLTNMANLLSVSLYNEHGLDISVPNAALNEFKINRAGDRKWKYRSESVVLDEVSVNGIKESGDIKMQEHIQIPAGGIWKINLILKDVKPVEKFEDVQNRILKPTKSLSPGKYKLHLFLLTSAQQYKPGERSAVYESPMIDVIYMDK